jgi:hypothetical protein
MNVSVWLSHRLKRQGISDARNNRAIQDFTRTHALLVAQNVARSGQRRVNQWVIEAIDPLQAGNARTIVKLESLREILSDLAAQGDSSGRKQKTLLKQVRYLENQKRSFSGQYEANIARARTCLLQAEQAIESWVHYYEQMASIYTRARAAKLKVDVSSVQAEVPELESIELVEIQSLESRTTETKVKARA